MLLDKYKEVVKERNFIILTCYIIGYLMCSLSNYKKIEKITYTPLQPFLYFYLIWGRDVLTHFLKMWNPWKTPANKVLFLFYLWVFVLLQCTYTYKNEKLPQLGYCSSPDGRGKPVYLLYKNIWKILKYPQII